MSEIIQANAEQAETVIGHPDAERAALVKALRAAKGYMLNAKIDLQTGTKKQTTLNTLEGGIRLIDAALRSSGEA